MSIKKTIIVTVAIAASVAMVAPMFASATTVSDLMAEIALLQTQLNGLTGTTTATTTAGTGACAGVTFTRNLVVGSVGQDVKCLQQMLLVTPMSGYFGPITLAAVRDYQQDKGFTPANQVGPMTRAALNATLAAGSTTTTSGLPAGCTTTAGFSPTTGVACSTVTTTTTTTTTPGAIGFITIPSLAASPASNANVTATSNVPVLGLDVQAIGNSVMNVTSAQVQLTDTKNGTAEHPATTIRELYVYDGSTLLGSYPVNTNTVNKDSSNVYYIILSGFNFVIPANTTKTLTINADFAPALETSRVLTFGLYATNNSSLGATDGSGVNRTATIGSTRQYTITYATVGTSTLTVTADTATPISTSINVNATSGTSQDVPMLLVDAKSATGASIITNLKFTVTGDNTGVAKMNDISLWDGSTLLGSQSLSSAVSGATATFTNLSIPVAQDATKQLTVKAGFASGVTNSTLGVTVAIANPSLDVTYTTPNLSSLLATTSTAVTSNAMYLLNGKSADLTFMSATSTYSYNTTTPSLSYTTGVITFKAHANGGTMLALTNATASQKVFVNYNGNSLATGNVSVDFAPVGGTDGSAISDGGDAIVTVTMTVPRSLSGTGFINFSIPEIDWTVGAVAVNQTWGLSSYKTPYANVQ